MPSGTNSGHGRNPVSGGNSCAGHLGSTTPQNRVSSAIALLSVVDRAAHERGRALSLSQPRKELCPTPKGDGTKRPEPPSPRGPRLSPKSIPDSLAPVRVLIHRGGAYLLIYFLSSVPFQDTLPRWMRRRLTLKPAPPPGTVCGLLWGFAVLGRGTPWTSAMQDRGYGLPRIPSL